MKVLVLALAALVGTSVCSASSLALIRPAPSKQSETSVASPGESVFGSQGFAVTALEGWTVSAGRATDQGFRVEVPLDSAAGSIAVTITSSIVPEGTTCDTLLEAALESVQGRAEYRAHQVRAGSALAGRPTACVDLTWETEALGRFTVRQTYLVQDTRALLVQSYAPESDYDRHAEAFEAIAATIRFAEPSDQDRASELLRTLAERCGTEADWADSWSAAQRRAEATGRHVLVVVHAYSGFDIPDTTQLGTFMDEDVLAMVRERLVPVRLSASDPSPLQDRAVYGLSSSVLGVALILMTAEGEVLADTPHAQPVAVLRWLRHELSRAPEPAEVEWPSDPVAAATHALDRGELKRAEGYLGQLDSAEADVQRGRLALLRLDGAGALAAWDRAVRSRPELGPELACDRAAIHFLDGDTDAARGALAPLVADPVGPHHDEATFLMGRVAQSELNFTTATRLQRELVRRSPESRWAWQAAAYLELAPLLESISSTGDVAWPRADVLDTMLEPPRAPLPASQAEDAEQRALDWLVARQRDDGSWPAPNELGRTKDGLIDPITAAVNALCAQALLQRGAGFHERVERALAFLVQQDRLRRSSEQPVVYMDYTAWSVWAQLDLIADALEAGVGDAPALRQLGAGLVEDVRGRVRANGGWSYYLSGDAAGQNTPEQSISFTTAAVILGLERARELGLDVPEGLLPQALDCLESMRDDDGLFAYMAFHPGGNMTRNPAPGAAGRGPACELALLRGERSNPERVRRSLTLFHEHSASLAAEVGKALMHAGPETQGCHYPMFDYLMAARAARSLSEPDVALERARIHELVLDARLEDGGFLDTPILGPSFGTAAALLTFGALAGE